MGSVEDLLELAKRSEFRLDVVDGQLSIQGPSSKRHIVRQLQEQKAAIIAALTGQPMNGQAVDDYKRIKPKVENMSDVEAKPVSWLWWGRFALGRITLLVGTPGEGKSFLSLDMAAHVSTGNDWPDGCRGLHGDVLLVTAEDDPHDTIRPRLDALGADVKKVHLLVGKHYFEADGTEKELAFTLADIDILDEAIRDIGDVKLVVIDPIGSFLSPKTDAHRDNEVRSVLAPLAKLAEKHGTAIVLVAHRRKATGGSADDSALGSRAFTGIARAAWHLSRDKDDKRRRLLLPGKNNLSDTGTGLAFTITGDPPTIVWEPDPVAMHADDAMGDKRDDDDDRSATSEASDWLIDALSAGRQSAKELIAAAKRDGISDRTLRRAKAVVGVLSGRDDPKGPWYWQLPDGQSTWPTDPGRVNVGHVGNLDENPAKNTEKESTLPTWPSSTLPGFLGNVADAVCPHCGGPASVGKVTNQLRCLDPECGGNMDDD